MARSLEEIDQIRRRVINVVGHELRTPMTTLRGLAEQLAIARDDEERRTLTEALVRNAVRAEHLLDDLLVGADVSTALPLGDPEPVDVVAAARRAWASLGPPAARDLVVAGADDSVVLALSRSESLERIFRHVLDNAVKYATGPVHVRVALDDDVVSVEIASAGGSLPAHDLILAFEVFYRGEHAVTSSPGLGIGLPVSRALARQHGGDVLLRDGAGEGVIVRLELLVP